MRGKLTGMSPSPVSLHFYTDAADATVYSTDNSTDTTKSTSYTSYHDDEVMSLMICMLFPVFSL